MMVLGGVMYYTPREIADSKLIVNSRGNGDYYLVHRLINSGRLKALVTNPDAEVKYKLVSNIEIERYNNSLFKGE